MAGQSSASTASLAGANAAGLAGDATKFVGNAVPDLKPFGGAGGLGAGMGADLGKARLVGAMSVPPTWQGSMPARMVSSAMSGMGGMPNAAAMAGAAQGGRRWHDADADADGWHGRRRRDARGHDGPRWRQPACGAKPAQRRPTHRHLTSTLACQPLEHVKWVTSSTPRRIPHVRACRGLVKVRIFGGIGLRSGISDRRAWGVCVTVGVSGCWRRLGGWLGWGCDGFGICVVAAGD